MTGPRLLFWNLNPAQLDTPPEQTPLRKVRQLWILAAVSYGSVIVVILLSVWTYLHFFTARERVDDSTSVAIGSVWLPVYPGSVVESANSTAHDHATESVLRFKSKDPAAKILAFYEPKLRTVHFESYLSRRTGDGGMLQAGTLGRNTTVVITAQSSAEGSEGQITTLDR